MKTQRDAWCFNASRSALGRNIDRTSGYFNERLTSWQAAKLNAPSISPEPYIVENPSEISWSAGLKADFARERPLDPDAGQFVASIYRPFFKEWLYYSRRLNERVYQMPHIFPDADAENRVIMVKSNWRGIGQFALMMDTIPELQTDGGSQCFPLKLYEQVQSDNGGLFAGEDARVETRDGVTDEALAHFRAAWPTEQISKEDLFYYIYGLLHSSDYRERYADNLLKELPRIPAVISSKDYRAFRDAGRKLADLHVNYESVEPYPVTIKQGHLRLANIADKPISHVHRVELVSLSSDQGQTTYL